MYWKGLRIGNESNKRHSVIDPQAQARHSEQLPRTTLSTTQLAARHSESAPRSPPLTGPDDHDEDSNNNSNHNGGDDGGARLAVPGLRTDNNNNQHASQAGSNGPSFSSNEAPTMRRNRFSFMRFRYASDPQLSKSYAKGEDKVPPVPSLPPPTIITTAPTSHDLDPPAKRKSKLNIFPSSIKSSVEDLSASMYGRNQDRTTKPLHGTQGSTDSQNADLSLSHNRGSADDPGRLSTASMRSNARDTPNDSHRSSVTDARFSESSRSDQSLGEHGVQRTASPRDGSMSSAKRFRMPRLKRNRAPLFPLPPKPTGAQSTNGRRPNATMTKSITADGIPKSDPSDGQEQDHVSPLPSPSRSVVVPSSRPPLNRNDSATSTHSANSSASNRNQNLSSGRIRSNTMESVNENQELPPGQLASSGRTSTSTSGRKSFGDIFNIPQRLRQNSEPATPRNASPGAGGSTTPSKAAPAYSVPDREEGDTPASYLTRLEQAIPRGGIAGILAQSGDEFYKTALRKYMRGFAFFGDPIDMSIRKLLMEVELPKETQQIDRFLQAFADRYHECNPGIFASTDQAYFISFSILILHTDVFNKNNKRKMQKPDYVKNTGGEGISNDILECFYDNISYTPFIHIEDANTNGRHLPKPRRMLFKTASSEHLSRAREPVDPYALILDGKLDSLRPSLKDVMILDDTYSCTGTAGPPDMDSLHQAFAKSGILQIVSARSRPDAFMPASLDNPADSNPGLVDIKVAKVGLLWRKDPKKKRGRSPWQEWGALLTFSQLYLFRDVNWVRSLMSQYDSEQKEGSRRAVIFSPPLTDFKPDGIMSTDDAVALLDYGYKKHKHAFVYVRHNALEEVFLANSEEDMNDWLAKLNYAAAFRTTGVRTKGMITNYEAQRDRIARMSTVVPDDAAGPTDNEPRSPTIPDTEIAEELVAARRQLMGLKVREANEKLFVGQRQLDDLLRNARHLQVLTPVHSRAREQVIMAAGRMSAKLKWVRQDIWRTRCHREVLVRDLGEDEEHIEKAPLAEKESLRIEIPSDNPAKAEAGTLDGTQSAQQASPIKETPVPASPVKAMSVDKISLPRSPTGDIRRPSIPISITSSELAHSGRRLSASQMKDRAKSSSPDRTSRLEREASVLSANSRIDVSSLASKASKITSPSIDDGEERVLREAGLLEVNSSPKIRKEAASIHDIDSDKKQDDSQEPQSEQSGRIRRSLHRTLRESSHGHNGHHLRNKKTRDSVSSVAASEDDKGSVEGEGLSRKYPSFTVHGKKASIVTFGSEWQNMPPEERLKLRKPTPSEEPRMSDPSIASSGDSITSEPLNLNGLRAPSVRSASTARSSSRNPDQLGEAREENSLFQELAQREPSFVGGDDATDQSSKTSDTDTLSPTATPRATTHNGLLAVPDEEPLPSSASADDHAVDDIPPEENLKHSPPEQAVGA